MIFRIVFLFAIAQMAMDAQDAAALYQQYVPRDKGLEPDWIASLTERGHPLDAGIAHDAGEFDPEVIGATVGGIGCGTVYLSGDGRLWVWDIFNQHHEGVVPNSSAKVPAGLKNIQGLPIRERDGANFVAPPKASQHRNGVDARFALNHAGKDRPLDRSGWDKVRFTGRWPLSRVDYASSGVPLRVSLEAYSPFIPLDLGSSSLPVTVMEYTVENNGAASAEATLTAHLNNPAGQFSKLTHLRRTDPLAIPGCKGLFHHLGGDDGSAAAQPALKPGVLSALDAGSMTLAALGREDARVNHGENTVSVPLVIPAGGRATVRFAITWHFPNLSPKIGVPGVKRHYAKSFADARAVLAHFAERQDRLCADTREWVATWNDSSLPQWLLDRTILTTNTLQTQNVFLFDNGRFWAWEGIGACHGTCGHVWQYSQGHARLFPEIERNLREVTDFKLAQNPDGSIRFRGTNSRMVAIDAQCAYVIRTLRDHQLSNDPGFLQRVWPAARMAMDYLIRFDAADARGGLDGLLDGEQHNTLDAEWYGKVHVLCSMYLAALRAGEELAIAAGDGKFAAECRRIYQMGAGNIATLYNGEYYIQIEDPAHPKAIGVGTGCYIDQAMGQFWANQVDLGRLYDQAHQKSALRALWQYNFVPDYGAFRQGFPDGRHYAGPGDSGLLMCTWPKGGLREDFKKHWQYAYFNEFMTGFEYQAAAHMIAERDPDLVRNGLAITRAIHDRYSAARGRNPYNEIECSDHYARAGASYAVFLAVCGFHFDQSKGLLAFDPVIRAPRFKAAFTASEGWGTYEQENGAATLTLRHGSLALRELRLGILGGKEARLTLNGQPATLQGLTLKKGDVLRISPAG